MQECINLVISGLTISRSTSRNELEILGQSISMFNQQVKMAKRVYAIEASHSTCNKHAQTRT